MRLILNGLAGKFYSHFLAWFDNMKFHQLQVIRLVFGQQLIEWLAYAVQCSETNAKTADHTNNWFDRMSHSISHQIRKHKIRQRMTIPFDWAKRWSPVYSLYPMAVKKIKQIIRSSTKFHLMQKKTKFKTT